MIALGVIAVAASIYLVYVLEILKFKHRRTRQLRARAVAHASLDPQRDIDRPPLSLSTGLWTLVPSGLSCSRRACCPCSAARVQ